MNSIENNRFREQEHDQYDFFFYPHIIPDLVDGKKE